MYRKLKNRIFEIINTAESGDKVSKAFDVFIISLIVLNTVMVIVDTFDVPQELRTFTEVFETVSVFIFTAEYLLRLWTADLYYPDKRPAAARVRYAVTFMAVIDLLSILPFYIPFVIPIDLRVLRTLRIIRIFRLFKVNRYTHSLSVIGKVFRKKAHQLISSMLVVSILILIAAVIMYNVESEAQPEVFENAFSGIWWAIATLTTVGYGDIYPVTAAGRFISAIIAFLGIGLVAVPTGIISAGFMENIEEEKKEKNAEDEEKCYCPYCGKKIQ
jgi:voltage-gated potassium channel